MLLHVHAWACVACICIWKLKLKLEMNSNSNRPVDLRSHHFEFEHRLHMHQPERTQALPSAIIEEPVKDKTGLQMWEQELEISRWLCTSPWDCVQIPYS